MISVVIPAYNAARYLVTAIESVLNQSVCHHTPLELIVIDDGSTDQTAEIAQAYPTIYHRIDHAGIATARNQGIRVAQSAWVAFLDADDIWHRQKLAWQLECLATDPGIDLVFGHVQQFLSQDLSHPERFQCISKAMPWIAPATALIRRSLFDTVGDFNPIWPVGEWLDWYSRAQAVGCRSQMIDPVVLYRRIHDRNSSNLTRQDPRHYVQVIKSHLDRQRQHHA